MILALLALVAGIVTVAVASDQFVLGAGRLARVLGVPAVVVGVVLVGFGTSLPEMVVSVLAVFEGEAPAATGNVVGSNIANLSLLLGIGAIISPIAVPAGVLRRELPLVLFAAGVLVVVVPGGITVVEGAVLLAGMAAVLAWQLQVAGAARRDAKAAAALDRGDDDAGPDGGAVPVDVPEVLEVSDDVRVRTVEASRALAGLIGTTVGSQLLLSGALGLADVFGLTSGVVGLVLLAVGTSLPELVTVVQSVRRGEDGLVMGNLLGSNLFNSLAVAGLIGTVGAAVPDPDVAFSAIVGLGVTIAVSVAIVTGRRVTRSEGVALCAIYAAMLAFVL